jgi:4-hydroxyphenylpyruvate dioxygenase
LPILSLSRIGISSPGSEYPEDEFDAMTSPIRPILGIDHLELFVGNAKQAAFFYTHGLGFQTIAYRGLETGDRKTTSYLLEQGAIRLLLSSALTANHPIAHSVVHHGDTVAVVALAVSDVAIAYNTALAQGAIAAIPPTTQTDGNGSLRYAALHSFGDVIIKLIDRQDYSGVFAPGFVPCTPALKAGMGLTHIDHIVGNVEQGTMESWTQFLMRTLGFERRMQFDDRAISTEYSALMSTVLEHPGSDRPTLINLNEPAPGRCQSQIAEYLLAHAGPGIQHIGLATENIVETVGQLRQAGVEFLPIPSTYYENLAPWVAEVGIPVRRCAELGILVDRDAQGYLLQLFTKPVGDRPTLFLEIIERHGSRGFGAGNFKSLFMALEQEQARRGNLS